MASNTSNALNAIGTLIGYIGTEVATDNYFERLLWPHRAYNGFTWKHIPQMALLMPMGGPLHKAALSTLDDFYKHGLFERYQNGHMLGTAFFRDMKLKYRAFGSAPGWEDEHVRNGLLVRAIMNMRPPILEPGDSVRKGGDEPMPKVKPQVRQRICVSLLKLSKTPVQEKIIRTTTVSDDATSPTFRTYLAQFATELSAIVVAIVVAVRWKSAFAALWLMPLALKLISTAITVKRERLVPPAVAKATSSTDESSLEDEFEEEIKLFGVRIPAGGFVLIEATDSLMLQFFRHYGHPVRSRLREKIEIAIVVAFTLNFPIGLVCSTLWMSNAEQTVWVAYQLYATLAMYIYRYMGGSLWCTTEEVIGNAFFEAEIAGESNESLVMLKAQNGDAIAAKLNRSSHERFAHALEHVEQMINVHQKARCSRRGIMPAHRTSSELSTPGYDSRKRTNTEGWEA